MEITFGANLTVDKNFAKNPPKRIDRENLLRVRDEYREFLETDKIVNRLMPLDTVELSTHNEKDGYFLTANFYEDGKEEPVEEFICIGKKSNSQFNINSLKTLTYFFIAQKSGEKPRLAEGILHYIKRGVFEYAKQCAKKEKE